ncbi:MAG: nitrate reductase [Gammaproteobacteria bacterium HGW-Gammaproteobacteria-1]|jgi:assimilatory nitrate reductase catalytic subunit|nr:MAG: nitrate reductase [Gammaproteobacteria bacterium HGW-Gammaproteobacteria-1]
MTIKTTCPYCGTGCGLIAEVGADGVASIKGDIEHPANYGRLCSKGAALGETLDLEGRLLQPQINGAEAGWSDALDTVAVGLRDTIEQHGPDAVAFYVSGQLLTEDYYVANKLMKGFLGSANIDTNSRLCMASSVAGHKRAFGSDSVPCSYEDLERAKLIVLVGSNAAWCHPVLYQRIAQARRDHPDLQLVVIDPRRTASCEGADMHLPLAPGSDAVLFNGLLAYLHAQGEQNQLFTTHHTQGLDAALAAAHAGSADIAAVAAACDLAPETVRAFYSLFARTERVVTVYSQGVNQSSSGTDKVNAIINCHLYTGRIGRPGMGPFSFTGQPNAMGGREVGGLANQLAAHMNIEDDGQRALVQDFWNAPHMASRAGRKAVDLFQAIAAGEVKAVWIMGTNPVVSLPDADRARAALQNCPLVIVSDCMADTDTMRLAHIRLPALAWGEKDGTVTNSERRISRQRAFLPAPGAARPDWWIVAQVAQRLGHGAAFAWNTPAAIFREHAALSGLANDGRRGFDIGALHDIDDDTYARLKPVQWPVTASAPNGTARLFGDGRFHTADGRARFIAVTPQAPKAAVDADFPLRLNTGRLRDQWHTMTRTGKSIRLSSHDPEPCATLHPLDAADLGIADGALVRVASPLGEVIMRAALSDAQRRGDVFAPMHWNDRYSARGRINTLVAAHTDPHSGQPESKHAVAAVTPFAAAWHGLLLTRRRLAPGTDYWSCARSAGAWRYRLAGAAVPDEWATQARALLCAPDHDVGWIEYLDSAGGRYRAARLVNGRIESCLFVAPTGELPDSDWLETLFAEPFLSPQQRQNLLTGRAPQGGDHGGGIVCACHGVRAGAIRDAIAAGAATVDAIGAASKAGTGCGSCVPEIRQMLHG